MTRSNTCCRAICDERITLPLSAFQSLDTIYTKLAAKFSTQTAMIEVKINWRCNNVIWWAALIEDETMAAQLSCPTLSRRRRTFCPRPEVWGLPLAVKNRRPTAQGKAPPADLGEHCLDPFPGFAKEAHWQQALPRLLGQDGMRPELGQPVGICPQRGRHQARRG